MKKITYLLFATVILLTGCVDDFQLGDNELTDLSVSELPAYVAFSAPGVNITIDDIVTAENLADLELNVEVPGGTLSDVTVNFEFGGTAVFGVDFNIAGASSTGGSFIIEHVQSTNPVDAIYDNGDIVVDLLTDDVADGVKTLEVILVSASNAEGELAVGRGGTDLLKTTFITILDFCELNATNIVGDWVLNMQDVFGDGWNGASVTVEIDGVGTNYDLDTYTLDGGSTATVTITVPTGSTTLRFLFNSGDWDSEVTFQIISPNGNEIGSYGINPPIGELIVDACAI